LSQLTPAIGLKSQVSSTDAPAGTGRFPEKRRALRLGVGRVARVQILNGRRRHEAGTDLPAAAGWSLVGRFAVFRTAMRSACHLRNLLWPGRCLDVVPIVGSFQIP
jgi:hypothetical protein